MYKVLLVDDEPMALEMLKYVIDWESCGFWICGTCKNGKEAIEAIDKYDPEVVITDIKMPVIDGLDLIKYTRENKKNKINFVLVSGYGEFEYARKAMKYDVRYYLQKPILDEDVNEALSEIKKQLDKQEANKIRQENDKKAVINGILEELIFGSDEKKALDYLKRVMHEKLEDMNWNCIIVEFEEDKTGKDSECKINRSKARQAIESFKDLFVVEQNASRLIALQGLKVDEADSNRALIVAQNIYDKLISQVCCNFVIAVGENVEEISSVKHSYSTALEVLKESFYHGTNSIISYEEIKGKQLNFEFNEVFMSSKVFEAVEEADIKKLKSTISITFDYFKKNRIAPEIVHMFVSNMIFKINNLIYENKADNINDNNSIIGIKENKSTIDELKIFFENFCINCCEHFNIVKHNNSKGNIDKIEAFIRENYRRNLTLRELAENVYMHPAYLGQLFTQKFGMGFNEYIHLLRIEEAKKLLSESKLKNCEVAEKLGYSNYNSFLQQFQKYTGMKPKEFRGSKS